MTHNSYLSNLAFLYKLDKAKQATQKRTIEALSFTDFKRQFWPRYEHTPFHQVIDEHLTSVFNYVQTGEGISRLQIFMPPRYGKTRSVSRMFPAWVLGNNPSIDFIIASYGARLAQKNSRAVRGIIQSTRYQERYPNTRLMTDKKAADEWQVQDHEGGMVAVGVGGGITGFGGRIIIVDDPIKSRADAESQTIRQNIHAWYTDDLYTRLDDLDYSAIIIINTRWHHDDLSGYLLSDNIDEWTVLNFPALAGENDILGRKPDEPLWPRKNSFEDLKRKEAQMGQYSFEALFQQNPQQTKGRLFDTGLFIGVPDMPAPHLKKVVRFYDLASTTKERSSYTVGLKLGLTYDDYFVILDVYRRQAELPDIHQDIMANAEKDGTHVPIVLETEKSGIAELQFLHREPRMLAYEMRLQTPKGDKYTRATPIASKVNGGRVKLVMGTWNKAFKDELAVFPNGAWNDQVDALSGAFRELAPELEGGDMSELLDFFNNYKGGR